MKIIICGAGEVGFSLAKYLASEDMQVTVIDDNINRLKKITAAIDVRSISGKSYNPNRSYSLNYGPNLVSFPAAGTIEISDGLPDDIEDNVIAVIGANPPESTINTGDGWQGSLSAFEGGRGYWMITNQMEVMVVIHLLMIKWNIFIFIVAI